MKDLLPSIALFLASVGIYILAVIGLMELASILESMSK